MPSLWGRGGGGGGAPPPPPRPPPRTPPYRDVHADLTVLRPGQTGSPPRGGVGGERRGAGGDLLDEVGHAGGPRAQVLPPLRVAVQRRGDAGEPRQGTGTGGVGAGGVQAPVQDRGGVQGGVQFAAAFRRPGP